MHWTRHRKIFCRTKLRVIRRGWESTEGMNKTVRVLQRGWESRWRYEQNCQSSTERMREQVKVWTKLSRVLQRGWESTWRYEENCQSATGRMREYVKVWTKLSEFYREDERVGEGMNKTVRVLQRGWESRWRYEENCQSSTERMRE